jgi:hypothetical protein
MRRCLPCLLLAIAAVTSQAADLPDFYKKVDRIVWVVKSLQGPLDAWKVLGLTDVHDAGTVQLQLKDRTGSQSPRVHLAIGSFGDLTIEFVQPVDKAGAFSSFLEHHGNGIFAIVHRAPNAGIVQRETARLRQHSVPVLQTVSVGNSEGAVTTTYFDTESRGKYVLGLILDPAPESRQSRPHTVTHIATVIRTAPPVSDFWSMLGFPALDISHATPRPDSRYRGSPLTLSFDVGWQRHTQYTYEWIIPPSTPPNVYADYLKLHGEGVQHLGIAVPDLPAAIARYEKLGYTVWQSGAWGNIGQKNSGQYAYMDTDRVGGVLAELIHAY